MRGVMGCAGGAARGRCAVLGFSWWQCYRRSLQSQPAADVSLFSCRFRNLARAVFMKFLLPDLFVLLFLTFRRSLNLSVPRFAALEKAAPEVAETPLQAQHHTPISKFALTNSQDPKRRCVSASQSANLGAAPGSCAAAGLAHEMGTSGRPDVPQPRCRESCADALCTASFCCSSRLFRRRALSVSAHQSWKQKGLACRKQNEPTPLLSCIALLRLSHTAGD